jgi:PAS domain S-box-containing protein
MQEVNDFYAQRLEAVINTAIDGIITINTAGRIESANAAAQNLFGYSATEMIGRNISMLMPQPHHSQHDGYLNHYDQTGEKKIIGIGREVKGKKKDGTLFPFRLAVSEVNLGPKKIFTGIIHDLTDIKAAQEEVISMNLQLEEKVEQRTNELESVVNQLLKVNRQLEEKEQKLKGALEVEKELNDLKSRFLSTASHEFRTPLSTILSSASIIEKYKIEEHQDKRLRHTHRIRDSVNHLNAILNDFLSISKLEEGDYQPQWLEVDLPSFLEQLKEQISEIYTSENKGGIRVESDVDQIISDPHIIKNILINLLSNAIKYSDSKEVCCTVGEEDTHWIIAVEDQGMGVPQSEQKHLFERFFRASNAVNIQGTGLGLSIVSEYVKQLGGEIYFESEENVGSTFIVKLPKKKL